ncbi:hypothetical protein TNIN_101211 [Trichonephila inaurata madagascariensis]|uniref:Uncharacterized protein n=1 Tax=Trichonephila inaurata madagascariensis TaxID=2747483 RepID=A0A8X6YBD1_9ARAC|nr:hypothetical protein TNIN_101211 [Trichonephila inaurata madagascariensis]
MIIPAVLGAILLGLAFDMKKFDSNPTPIYDMADIKSKLQVTPEESLESKYLVVQNTSDLIDFFNLDPALALRGIYGSEFTIPFQEFLRAGVDRQRVTEILFYVKYKACIFLHNCEIVEKALPINTKTGHLTSGKQTRTFPSDTKLTTDWQRRPQEYVGTHFVKSISSGGRLLLSFRVRPMKTEYVEEVRNAIDSHLGQSGTIDEELTGKRFFYSNTLPHL